MTTTESPIKSEQVNTSATETQKQIISHTEIAENLEKAAKHHKEAANHLEAGNAEKAQQSKVEANNYLSRATEEQKKDVRNETSEAQPVA